jgi:UDP-glucose 4-epimerase
MGAVLLRYFSASGADTDGAHGECRRKESHLIPLVLAAALGQRDEVLVFGGDWPTRDGSCVRDYIHVEDLAEAHRLAVEAVRPGEVRSYNLGVGEGFTVLEVVKAAERVVGHPIPHRIVDRRPGDPGILITSPERITSELGWQPRYTAVEDIVRTAWAWHQANPNGYRAAATG